MGGEFTRYAHAIKCAPSKMLFMPARRFADRNLKEQHHAKAAQGAAAVKSEGEATGKAKKSRA